MRQGVPTLILPTHPVLALVFLLNACPGMPLSFEAAVANEDSPVTSHKNLQCHL